MDNIKRFKCGKIIAFIDLDKKEVVLIKTTKGYKRWNLKVKKNLA